MKVKMFFGNGNRKRWFNDVELETLNHAKW
jgi:hypothetical protein